MEVVQTGTSLTHIMHFLHEQKYVLRIKHLRKNCQKGIELQICVYTLLVYLHTICLVVGRISHSIFRLMPK